ncbi:MAG: SDR family NAD(P)-dependent oxidoreductase [Streptosporangiales bacterium]|nr:SDR family NAD(P)-dependent oxidoreductase [Streptosporangiales bacterium]
MPKKPWKAPSTPVHLCRHAGLGEPPPVRLALVPQRVALGGDHQRGRQAGEAGLLPGGAGFAMYVASKAFVRTFTEGVAAEARPAGVRVTCVLPGYVRTEMTTDLQQRGMPGPAWVSRERVVGDALRALAAGRALVVPGAPYKVVDGLLRVLPRALVRAGVARANG